MRIAIIGNGIAGLSTAEKILTLKSNLKVELYVFGDKNRNNGASKAAAAMIAVFGEIERKSLDKSLNKIKFEHALESSKLWINRFTSPKGYDTSLFKGGFGTYLIQNESKLLLDSENFDEIVKYLEFYNEEYEFIDVKKIPGYHPKKEWAASSAVYVPSEGWFDPIEYLFNLENILKYNNSVNFINGEVQSVEYKENSVLVKSHDEVFSFDKVVIANGARFNELVNEDNNFGVKIKILSGVGTTLRIKNENINQTKVIRSPNRGLACGMYTVPLSGNTLVVGATNYITDIPSKLQSLGAIETLMKMAFEQLNISHYDSELVSIQTGWRPVSTDLFPLIGWLNSRIFVYTGTRRDGWVTSELFSTKVAKMVLTEEEDSSLEIYSPKRNPHQIYSRNESVELATSHYLDGALQHGYVAPDGSYPTQIANNYRVFFEKLHQDYGMGEKGIPVDFIGLYASKLYDRVSSKGDWPPDPN